MKCSKKGKSRSEQGQVGEMVQGSDLQLPMIQQGSKCDGLVSFKAQPQSSFHT